MHAFDWLQKWYEDQCDGDWEHTSGIRLETLDNPGWSLDVSLVGTHLEDQPFAVRRIERSSTDWFHAFRRDLNFCGRCGPGNLTEVIDVFRRWASEGDKGNGL
jgi:hypothetical protein